MIKIIKKIILVVFLLVLILAPIYFFSWWNSQTSPVNPANIEKQVFVIPQGWGVEEISQRLKNEGLIKSPLAFKIMVVKEGISTKIQAGDFRLSPSMNLFEITQSLTQGTIDVWVTIPEGLRREEIANILSNSFAEHSVDLNKEEFLQETEDLEGFLFPDTYLIPKTASPEDIVIILRDNFEKKFNSLTLSTTLTKKQIITLASLVEREAKHDKDRPIIAGILIKRLKRGWPLQVDATVQYAKASQQSLSENWWPIVTASDLEIESLFNTYKFQGLPPTPICNPGLASIKAVIDPQDSDYWYYLSDKSGNVHYAETLEEQEENVSKYLNN